MRVSARFCHCRPFAPSVGYIPRIRARDLQVCINRHRLNSLLYGERPPEPAETSNHPLSDETEWRITVLAISIDSRLIGCRPYKL